MRVLRARSEGMAAVGCRLGLFEKHGLGWMAWKLAGLWTGGGGVVGREEWRLGMGFARTGTSLVVYRVGLLSRALSLSCSAAVVPELSLYI